MEPPGVLRAGAFYRKLNYFVLFLRHREEQLRCKLRTEGIKPAPRSNDLRDPIQRVLIDAEGGTEKRSESDTCSFGSFG